MIRLVIWLVIKKESNSNWIVYYRKKINYFSISLVFTTQSYFAVPKNITLNSTHYFVTKTPNKKKLQQIAFNHSSDIDFRYFQLLALWIFVKSVLENRILCYWCYSRVSNSSRFRKTSFRKNTKTNHDNWW